MCSSARFLTAAICLSFFLPLAPCPSAAQISSTPKQSLSAPRASAEQQPPFDKLELFGLFAAGPNAPYAKQVIQKRGCTFAPDAAFLAAFPVPAFQEILRNIKPRAAKNSSPERDAAYELLPAALDATHHRQFAVSDENYQKALALAPDSATLHLAYAANLLLVPDGVKAEPEARRSLELWPDNAEAHGILSLALMVQGKVAEAADEARKTLRIFPEHKSAKVQLAISLARNHQCGEAIPALRSAVLVWASMFSLHKFLGICLLQEKQMDYAVAELNLYVSEDPNDAEGHYFLGVALRSKSQQGKAHAQFQEALRLQPGNAQFEAAANPDATPIPAEQTFGPTPEDGSISGSTYTNKFFRFSYEFPKSWIVMSSEAARATVEVGSVLMSTGDPTEQDTKQATLKKGHPLLFVMEGRVRNQPIVLSSVQITALEAQGMSGLAPETLLKSIGERLEQAGATPQGAGSPEKLLLGGRDFWKINVTVPLGGGTRYVSEIVTFDKEFALFFVLATSSAASLAQMEQSLQSIRFLNSPD